MTGHDPHICYLDHYRQQGELPFEDPEAPEYEAPPFDELGDWDIANSPDPLDMLSEPHQDAVDVVCRIIRGMELAVQPWNVPGDDAHSHDDTRWEDMSEARRDEYRQLVIDVMADDYEHEGPQALTPRLLRLRMATVLLNF